MDKKQFETYQIQGDKFLKNIKDIDPNYLDNLNLAITNKNHLLLKKHILYGAKLILNSSIDLYINELEEKDYNVFYNKAKKLGFLNSKNQIDYNKVKLNFLKELNQDSEDATCIVWAFAYQSGVVITTYGGIAWLVYFYADFWGPELENYEEYKISFADGVQNAQTDLCIASYDSNISLEILVNDVINYND